MQKNNIMLLIFFDHVKHSIPTLYGGKIGNLGNSFTGNVDNWKEVTLFENKQTNKFGKSWLYCLHAITCGDPDPVLSLGDLRIAPYDGDTHFSAVLCLVGLVMSCAYLWWSWSCPIFRRLEDSTWWWGHSFLCCPLPSRTCHVLCLPVVILILSCL